ncbi:MAG: hypothetical protein JWN74_1188 [Acidobacteriaceae bacterium]|nr:hypothetical protein [Acidobacteriaceae bacterium]
MNSPACRYTLIGVGWMGLAGPRFSAFCRLDHPQRSLAWRVAHFLTSKNPSKDSRRNAHFRGSAQQEGTFAVAIYYPHRSLTQPDPTANIDILVALLVLDGLADSLLIVLPVVTQVPVV